MGKNVGKLIEEREELNSLYHSRKYKGLRYSAFAVIAAVIALQISMIIWMDDIPLKVMLFMRGCVGTGAIIFVVLVGILTYRVNSHHLKNRKFGNGRR